MSDQYYSIVKPKFNSKTRIKRELIKDKRFRLYQFTIMFGSVVENVGKSRLLLSDVDKPTNDNLTKTVRYVIFETKSLGLLDTVRIGYVETVGEYVLSRGQGNAISTPPQVKKLEKKNTTI